MFGRKKPKNIFELASQYGYRLVFVIHDNRVFVFPAIKEPDGTLRIITKDKRESTIYISPEQEFILYTPKIEVMNEHRSIFEYLRTLELKDPEVLYTIEPYRVETIFLIYPHEVLTKDQLKLLNLIQSGENYVVGDLKLPIYSPTVFGIDHYSVKTLSATAKLSQIDTILNMTKELIEKADAVLGSVSIRQPSSIFKNKKLIILIILLILGLIGAAYMLSNILGFIQAGTTKTITAPLQNLITNATNGSMIKTFP